MSQLIIAQAFEARLAALSPALSTAYENADFMPTANVAYQQAFLLPAQPDNSSMGDKHYRELGLYQITLCYPTGNGAGLARARAELTKTHFKRGTTMEREGLTIIVMRTPTISPPFIDGDRYKLALSVYYQCDVNL